MTQEEIIRTCIPFDGLQTLRLDLEKVAKCLPNYEKNVRDVAAQLEPCGMFSKWFYFPRVTSERAILLCLEFFGTRLEVLKLLKELSKRSRKYAHLNKYFKG